MRCWISNETLFIGLRRDKKGRTVRQDIFTVTDNRPLGADMYRMDLDGDTREICADGSFINLSVPGKYLRRPISVYQVVSGRATIVYKTVGNGTLRMSGWAPGTLVDVLTGLGCGYDLDRAGSRPLVVGGGYGAASLYGLTRSLALAGKRPSVILGFNTGDEAVVLGDFINLIDLGASVRIVTRDGSAGAQGLATDLIQSEELPGFSCLYACGPLPMLRALAEKTVVMQGQFSLEARMGCGFGACMGCSILTTRGAVRVCKEGPVFDKGEIIWTQV
ncbi:MAG TPA: dihydroorotate dehydrogenase electron transfer subunit [Clostridiales bacterium]|nr:dihydroorotate dehydrogenase electron transfer subunit [Clostridiales bacterium]